jgi:hypothetical protein
VKWAVCVPSSCGSEDVRKIVENDFENYLKDLKFEVEIKIQMREEMCQVGKEKVKIENGTKIFG